MPVNLQRGISKDPLVKLSVKIVLVSIVTSLLPANYKGNIMTRFSANKPNRF